MQIPVRKVALVTGVTRRRGIGAAIALALARRGADVCTGYYRPYDRTMPWGVEESEPEGILEDIREEGVDAYGFEVDLHQAEGPHILFRSAIERFGRIDVLVNNAAYSKATSVLELSPEEMDRHYTVNLRATMLLSTEFVRAHQSGAGGRIINVTSGQGLGPMPGELAYAATKGGIDAFTVSLSAAVAHLGITVNAVDPGPTDTGWMSEDIRETLRKAAPTWIGTPDVVAHLIAFLVSEDARWITGQVIRSRGGQ
jgi:3-oxoacyl-[acyl-carrier protein] reductase